MSGSRTTFEEACHRADAKLGRRASANKNTSEPQEVDRLAKLPRLEYDRQREDAAKRLRVRVGTLDRMVREKRASAEDDAATLPHWKVEPSSELVDGAALLDSLRQVFRRYIVLPKGAAEALALWTLHAWTADAGDISPLMVLISPTKRCGKTSVLIILYYLTPRSELASNISASAVFRYIQETRPTLLIDEADTFVRDNEQMRGILNSGHTKAAAHVIRNVEINGEYKPQRFSTWAPKAIATIRELADTLEDRAIIVTLQRKPKAAAVTRLRKRDNEEFATLRRQAARWAADNFETLTDPDPDVPEALNDRAADNWRPLLAIADIAGGTWPQDARRAACLLSGESQDSAMGVELLVDIRKAFGEAEAIRSAELVAKLAADPERPWAEWKHGRPLTQKQLGGLLRPFGIVSETVSIPGFNDAKGYKRIHFEAAWEAYCPGQNSSSAQSEILKRRNVVMPMRSAQLGDFRSVAKGSGDGSNNAHLSHSDAAFDASTDRKAQNSGQAHSGHEIASPDDGLDIPDFLLRAVQPDRRPALGPPGDSLDDLA
jgi:putative DNA primase/helicase